MHLNTIVRLAYWIYDMLCKVVNFVLTIPGMIISSVSALYAFFQQFIGDFENLTDLANWFDQSADIVDQIISSYSGPVQFAIYSVAVDVFIPMAMLTASATIGYTVLIFITCFSAVILVLPTIFTVKATLRLINVGSAGTVNV